MIKHIIAAAFLAGPALAQTAPAGDVTAEAFASENAILDTAVLFAIGAREANQELRGAFGWPTFQEGLVEGVYFRFDPDGYARFAPTPRLDTDVFEVICRPRTVSCMGRKQSLSMMLNAQGQLQLKLDDAAAGDQFFVNEGVTELPLPERILMPLDQRLETLLSAGGELVIRRGENEVARISLAGFSAVATYLRWVVARQDYTVLPRGWPVPSATIGADPSRLTQTAVWQSPMPQPQLQPIMPEPAGPAVQSEVAEVRGELNILRELLLERSGQGGGVLPMQGTTTDAASAAVPQFPSAGPALSSGLRGGTAGAAGAVAPTDRLADLERAALDIQREIALLRPQSPPVAGTALSPGALPVTAGMPVSTGQAAPVSGTGLPAGQDLAGAATVAPADDPEALAQRLSYLITEIGLDPRTAVMLLQLDGTASETGATSPQTQVETLYSDQVVGEIMRDLATGTPLPDPAGQGAPQGVQAALAVPVSDYVLLSDYFRSVFDPANVRIVPDAAQGDALSATGSQAAEASTVRVTPVASGP